MPIERRLALVPGCRVLESSDLRLVVDAPGEPVLLQQPDAHVREAVRRMAEGGAGEEELETMARGPEGEGTTDDLLVALHALHQRLRVCHRLFDDGRPLLTMLPMADGYRLDIPASQHERRVTLSRFAHLRFDGNEWVLESPLSPARAILHQPEALALLFDLGGSPAPPERKTELIDLLAHGGFLTEIDQAGSSLEESAAALSSWDFHDLLFHSRVRLGRHANPYGRTGDTARTHVPPPFKPATGEIIDLFRPDLQGMMQRDASLTRALEERRSRRRHGTTPLTATQLGEFLFRTARCTQPPADDADPGARVYPGGGGAYEIEIYPLVHRCTGLEPGLYHYRPAEHGLSFVAAPGPDTEALLKGGAQAALAGTPQVLLILAARFQRISSSYASVAYATLLKDVGAIFQTMSLVASNMDLAACALGGGDSDIFARAAAVPYLEEGSVGEFLLGSRADLPLPG